MSSPFDLPFDDEPVAPRRTIFTVTELTAGIRDLLETAYLDVWVEVPQQADGRVRQRAAAVHERRS